MRTLCLRLTLLVGRAVRVPTVICATLASDYSASAAAFCALFSCPLPPSLFAMIDSALVMEGSLEDCGRCLKTSHLLAHFSDP